MVSYPSAIQFMVLDVDFISLALIGSFRGLLDYTGRLIPIDTVL